jgi:signal peptidase II
MTFAGRPGSNEPADITPADITPADITPADITPADITPAGPARGGPPRRDAPASQQGAPSAGGAVTADADRWRTWLLVIVACAVVAADQWTKSWAQASLADDRARHIVGPIYLELTFNRGAAFSLGSGAPPVIVAVAVALAIGVLTVSGRLARGGANIVMVVALGLLSGGALSNLVDRFVRDHHGSVVDFVRLASWWPVFNVADASITVGAVAVALMLAFSSPAKSAPQHRTSAPPPGVPARTSPGGSPDKS